MHAYENILLSSWKMKTYALTELRPKAISQIHDESMYHMRMSKQPPITQEVVET